MIPSRVLKKVIKEMNVKDFSTCEKIGIKMFNICSDKALYEYEKSLLCDIKNSNKNNVDSIKAVLKCLYSVMDKRGLKHG